jgi:hypothetical protein
MASEDFTGNEAGVKDDDGKLDVADLVRMFEQSEEATQTARGESERDRDYVDGVQWTSEEISALEKRKQPILTDNRIKGKIDFLVGLEKQQRIDPRALPRTPQHEQDADGATQALRYVCHDQNYDDLRSSVWRNMLVEGAGGIRVYVEPSRKTTGYGAGELEIKIDFVAWDRMFWDPHSSRPDFSDAAYLGLVVWMDFDDALAKYPDGKEALDTTMASVSHTDTYDDKPRFSSWADKKRKRIRLVQMWIKRDDQWHFAEFTKGGILKAGPSPYRTDTGESDCELFFQSAFINRENERYGYVREMISPQDEVNKRKSKMLHLLSTTQIVMQNGAVNDVEKARKEAARPDGVIVVNPIGGSLNDSFQFVTRTDLAEANHKLLIEAQNAIDLKGPNATMLGEKTQGSAAASGKAIIASQQGGMVTLGDLLDHLRHLDLRVFRAIWNRIRQYWSAEKWIRTTDDERNVKWVGMNIDPVQLQMAAQQNPEIAQRVAGVVRNVAELDCDIIIDEAPDNLTPQLEQFQALVELKKMDANGEIPFAAIVEAIPNLKNRQRFLDAMDQSSQQPRANPAMETAQIELETMRAKNAMTLELQRQETEMRMAEKHASHDVRIRELRAEANPNHDNTLEAMQALMQQFQQGMMAIAAALNQPKQIAVQRDMRGKIVGAATI